eukprot:scaffold1850_cov194-Pinguiococcus_pyrenoidosus.AAC.63
MAELSRQRRSWRVRPYQLAPGRAAPGLLGHPQAAGEGQDGPAALQGQPGVDGHAAAAAFQWPSKRGR